MLPYLQDHFGDPGRLHEEGRTTRVAVETAREHVAPVVGARPGGVCLPGGGTGPADAAVGGALGGGAVGARRHVVTTAVEHSSVLDAVRRDPRTRVTVVGVD